MEGSRGPRDSPSPTHRVRQKSSQRRPGRRPSRKEDIDITLPDTSFPQRHEITQQDRHDRVHASAADARDGPRDAELHHVLREATSQAPEAEDGVGKEEAFLASENITEFAVQRLEAREGEEVPAHV